MKESFENFYLSVKNNKELNEMWNEVNERNRRNNRRANLITGAIFIAIIIGVLVYFKIDSVDKLVSTFYYYKGVANYLLKNSPMVLILIGVAFLFMILFIITPIHMSIYTAYTQNYGKFNNVYKKTIINALLNNFFTDVDYAPEKELPESIYKEGHYWSYDIYKSDDYMQVTLSNDHRMTIGEVRTYEEVREEVEDANGNKHVEYSKELIFGGLFVKVKTNNSIKNELRITQGDGVNYTDLEDLKMDSKEFEEKFDVCTTNKIVGMQILTHDVMDILLDFKNKYDEEFDIYVKNDVIYIRVHVEEMFESEMSGKEAVDKETLHEYYNIVEFIDNLTSCMIKTIEEIEF